ncbi:hypothetical protein [Wukongibacter sp. M2B1]|uniref:hypothetical protein n=1 Tax=Wukongibacter sp. M2B1 TaxID=3088895 RepID=UPI003D7A13E1
MKQKRLQTKEITFKSFMQIGLSITIILILILFGTMYYAYTSKLINENIQTSLRNFAVSAQYIIDGDLHEQITNKNSDLFREQVKVLADYKEEVGIYDVYTIIKDSENENETKFFLAAYDAEETFLQPYIYTEEMKEAFAGRIATTKKPYKDAFGTFYSGYAPLYNSKNEIVAIVAIDIPNEEIEELYRNLLNQTLIYGAISILIGNIVVYLTARYTGSYFKGLIHQLKKIGEGDLSNNDTQLSIIVELNDLAVTVNYMADQISELLSIINRSSNELENKANHINNLISTTDTSSQIISSAVEQMSSVHNHASTSFDNSLNELLNYKEDSKKSIESYKDILDSVQTTKDSLRSILQYLRKINIRMLSSDTTNNQIVSINSINEFESYCEKLYQDYDTFSENITKQILILDKISIKREKLVDINHKISNDFKSISQGNQRIIEAMDKQVNAIQGIVREVNDLECMANELNSKLKKVKTK